MSGATPLCRVRGWVLTREQRVLFLELDGDPEHLDTFVVVSMPPASLDVLDVDLATWAWLGRIVQPLADWTLRHGALPDDDRAVHLVLRAAREAGLTRDEVQDLRPDPLTTLSDVE